MKFSHARQRASPHDRPRGPQGRYEKTRKRIQEISIMRKSTVPILVAVLLVLGGVSAWLFVQNRDAKLAYQDLSASEESSRQSYNKTLDAIAEIQDSLDAITPRDSSFQPVPSSLATEQEMSGPDSRRALEHIAQLRASIERSRER